MVMGARKIKVKTMRMLCWLRVSFCIVDDEMKEVALRGPFYDGTNLFHKGPSSWPSDHPKALPHKSFMLRDQILTGEFYRDRNIHSISPL